MRGESTLREDDRGQSGVLGVALITALVVVGTVGIVALGTGVLADGRSDAQIESAEQAMTKLDATAALVALGRSDTQRASISLQGIGEHLNVNEGEGWMRVNIVNRSTGTFQDTVMNRTLGSIKYANGETTIAYQGGGVWKQVGDGSVMISPPEFHYRGNTLTLPLISVTSHGSGIPSGDLILKSTGERNQTFPNPMEDFFNPLSQEKQVNITVHSDFYDAWGRFFAQRTDGTVSYDHENETVVVELVVPEELPPFSNPFVQTSKTSVKAPGCNENKQNDDSDCTENWVIQDYPSADEKIERQVSDCNTGSSCINRSSSETDDIKGGETYYFPEGMGSDDFTIETNDEPVNIVVNGDIEKAPDISLKGNGTVRMYVLGDISTPGNLYLNWDYDTDPDQFILFVHSTGDITLNGNNYVRGLIYAPGSDLTWGGSGELDGYVVAGDLRLNGFPSHVISNPPSFDLNLGGPNIAYINYLYVSSIDLQVNGTAG